MHPDRMDELHAAGGDVLLVTEQFRHELVPQ